ncbi:AhpC/TSA family protein [Parabacteroides sp. OttesenSCG-928-G07]|nr:AhpC/TSA family protein [Parabacteroides sp. OttesenSCG-928-G07]
MIKRTLFFFIIICCLSSCSKNYTYRIEGKLSNLEDQTIYIVFEREDYRVVDTVICEKSGQFKFDQKLDNFNTANIFFENRSQWIKVYLEPGVKISISGDAKYPLLFNIKGGKINEQLNAVRKDVSSLLKEYTDLSNQMNHTSNSVEETDIVSKIANIQHQLTEHAVEYIKNHPEREVSVALIQRYFSDPDDTRKMDELLALLDPELKNFYLTKELEQYSVRAKRTAIGMEAPGFNVKNIYGESISLDTFSNKYLLLTFTAPWCDMCQTEDLYLDKIVTTYPSEEIDVLLVSLDDKSNEVRETLSNDSIQWNLVTDSAGQATMLLDLYNVSVLPRSFLIDEEGKIIMKTESGTEIKQTIEKLFIEED